MSAASSPLTALQSWSMPHWQGQREDKKDLYAIISIGHDYAETIDVEVFQRKKLLMKRFHRQHFYDIKSGRSEPYGTKRSHRSDNPF